MPCSDPRTWVPRWEDQKGSVQPALESQSHIKFWKFEILTRFRRKLCRLKMKWILKDSLHFIFWKMTKISLNYHSKFSKKFPNIRYLKICEKSFLLFLNESKLEPLNLLFSTFISIYKYNQNAYNFLLTRFLKDDSHGKFHKIENRIFSNVVFFMQIF